MLPLLINEVNNKRMTWQDVVRLTSHGAMTKYGLKNKGELAPGKDADLVVIDNAVEWTITPENQHSHCDWTIYEGTEIRGAVDKVFLRGKMVLDGDEVLGHPGIGEEL